MGRKDIPGTTGKGWTIKPEILFTCMPQTKHSIVRGNIHLLRLTLCLSTDYSFIDILNVYLQLFPGAQEIHWNKKKIFTGTPSWSALKHSCSICCFWSELYWTNSLYLAPTHLILRNKNTNVPGSSCSQPSGSAKVEGNKERPWILFMYVDAMFVVFIYFKREEYHIHFMLHCQHGAPSWEFGCRMRCQFWTGLFISLACHTCHSLPHGSTNVSLLRARRNKTEGFKCFFMFLSCLIYFAITHWHFIICSNSQAKKSPYQVIYNPRVKDKNHLSYPLWYINKLL